jgi:hypothetical protein
MDLSSLLVDNVTVLDRAKMEAVADAILAVDKTADLSSQPDPKYGQTL